MGNAVVGYQPRSTGSDSSVGTEGGGGKVDEILKRLGSVETQVSGILGIIPHLATKADLAEVKASVRAIEAVIPQLATKAGLAAIEAVIPQLATKADVASIETAIIKWIIATTLASTALAFTIAKFVH